MKNSVLAIIFIVCTLAICLTFIATRSKTPTPTTAPILTPIAEAPVNPYIGEWKIIREEEYGFPRFSVGMICHFFPDGSLTRAFPGKSDGLGARYSCPDRQHLKIEDSGNCNIFEVTWESNNTLILRSGNVAEILQKL